MFFNLHFNGSSVAGIVRWFNSFWGMEIAIEPKVPGEVCALFSAAENAYAPVVELLLQHSANTEIPGKFGHTFIFLAALIGDFKIVKL